MAKGAFHVCRCTGQRFSWREWAAWCDEHRNDHRKIVHQYKQFGYSISDVCLTPNKPINWQNKLCGIAISTAESDNGDWSYGMRLYLYPECRTSGATYTGADRRDYYRSEKEAIFAALTSAEKEAQKRLKALKGQPDQEDEEYRNEPKNTTVTAALKDLIRQINVYKGVFDPRQLSLFD